MKVLVTGSQGYIGAVLCELLQRSGYSVTGYDAGFYSAMALAEFGRGIPVINKDTRDAAPTDFSGVDAVIHLAAISNDPLGELDVRLTEGINFDGTMTLALAAKAAGVKRFIYSSSQSMYGVANLSDELDEDSSEKNPITTYARTEWDAEQELKKFVSEDVVVVAFRPSTVFGASPMLRTDIAFNNFVASAFLVGRIEVKSDGTPWRPVVHVRDVSLAFMSGLVAPVEVINGQAFNVGIPAGNFTVRELAEAVARAVPGSEIIFTGEHGKDARTYKVAFKKIFEVLGDHYKPMWNLEKGAAELLDFFKRINFSESEFRGPATNRLQAIKALISDGNLDNNLRWQKKISQ